MRRFAIACLAICAPAAARAQAAGDPVTVSGLIMPRDDGGMYLRNSDGQFEIEWTERTQVALKVNTRQFAGLADGVLRYRVHSSQQIIDFALPGGPVTGTVQVRDVAAARKLAAEESWIPESGLVLRFGEGAAGQLPTPDDPRFVGLWDAGAKPRTLTILGHRYELSLKEGGQTNALLFNVIGTKDCKPFVNRARAVGVKRGEVIVASEIHVTPIGDQAAGDDPDLPRYLVIGDSISGNYDRGLRVALAGKFNIHHPPTNCGPSSKGREQIVEWLGAYREPGRQWDVISFNFGHWDAGNDKPSYQANLEAVIAELQKTGAALIWVTTCPVPLGFPLAGELREGGRAPARTAGVMQRYLNPWASEVVARHAEISVCDQWGFVNDGRNALYKDWWPGRDVHFGGELGAALGRYLAAHVEHVLGIAR